MAMTVVDRYCEKCKKIMTNAHRAKGYIAQMYLDCMELTEGSQGCGALLLDLFDDFILSVIVGMMENVDRSLAERNEMFETVLAELGLESRVPLPLILVGHEVDEEDVQILYSLANDWRGANFWKFYMAEVNQAAERCSNDNLTEGCDSVPVSDNGAGNACSVYANQLGFELIGMCRDFAFAIEDILREDFPESNFDDLADNYISGVIAHIMK
ncbi:MAG: hypothetical protein PUG43_05930 [Clostridiales bacterium]|nr:hypothetical protein [Clostridiales bacterium]MDY4059971.1 hypothetical protein [Anaerovoracaceae bacterium]